MNKTTHLFDLITVRKTLYLPPTSVIIQSGMARLTIANISAAKNNVPEIKVNLSIAIDNHKMLNSKHY